jgi:hypothetical protein
MRAAPFMCYSLICTGAGLGGCLPAQPLTLYVTQTRFINGHCMQSPMSGVLQRFAVYADRRPELRGAAWHSALYQVVDPGFDLTQFSAELVSGVRSENLSYNIN